MTSVRILANSASARSEVNRHPMGGAMHKSLILYAEHEFKPLRSRQG